MLSLALAVVFLFTTSAFAATLSWDSSDIAPGATIIDEDFDGSTTIVNSSDLDKTTFAGDPEHLNVFKQVASYSRIRATLLRNYILGNHKLNVRFEYYAAAQDTLRVEFRDMARNVSNGEIQGNHNKYWQGGGTEISVTPGEWHTFEGTFDIPAYLNELKARTDFSFLGSQQNLLIQGRNGTAVYVDNVVITTDAFVLPTSGVSYAYDKAWGAGAAETGHSDIRKSTINVMKAGVQSQVFAAYAPGYFIQGAKYQISFNYKEDAANPYTMTRMLRFYNDITSSGAQVKVAPSNGYLYFNAKAANAPALGTWKNITQTFTIGTEDGTAALADSGAFSIYWEGRAGDVDNAFDVNNMCGDYTIYIADFSVARVPEASANSSTVVFDENQYISAANNLAIGVEGYFDESVTPFITIDGNLVPGVWNNVTVNGKYRTGTATFNDVSVSTYNKYTSYSASLNIQDIWGNTQTNPVTVNVSQDLAHELNILTGDWGNLCLVNGPIVFVKGDNGWKDGVTLTDYFNNGTALLKFSFNAQGVKDGSYNDLTIAFRSDSINDIFITIPAADLKDGEAHTYTKIIDLGGMNRRTIANGTITDRLTRKFTLYIRSGDTAADTVTYSNIKLQHFDPAATNKAYVVSRLKVINNSAYNLSPNGTLIFAKYDSNNKLVTVNYKTVSYSDTDTLINTLGQNESKYIYLTGYETQDGIQYGEQFYKSTNIEENNGSYGYKAFYWNGIGEMCPITGFASKPIG